MWQRWRSFRSNSESTFDTCWQTNFVYESSSNDIFLDKNWMNWLIKSKWKFQLKNTKKKVNGANFWNSVYFCLYANASKWLKFVYFCNLNSSTALWFISAIFYSRSIRLIWDYLSTHTVDLLIPNRMRETNKLTLPCYYFCLILLIRLQSSNYVAHSLRVMRREWIRLQY